VDPSAHRALRPLLALAAALLLAPAAARAGKAAPAAPIPACRDPGPAPAALRALVETLALRFAPRDQAHPEVLERAAAWLETELAATGARVRSQPFTVAGRRYRNVIAEVGPETAERIVVGAHYDSAGDQPGADDNASGVAGLVELTRLLVADPPPLRVELVAFALEEPPAFRTPDMGSAVHAAALRAAGVRVRLMASLEMLGAFSDAPGSQRYPPVVGIGRPSTGNFIAVVHRWGEGPVAGVFEEALRRGSTVPVERLGAPSWVQGVDFSDHLNYWREGFPALMVTDTAFLRNGRYHTREDTPETLDYVRMAEVVRGVRCAVHAVARRAD